MTIHERIVAKILSSASENAEVSEQLCGMDTREILKSFFVNYKANNLRLLDFGNKLLSQYVKSYEIKFPEDFKFRPKHALYLSRSVKNPYFIDYKNKSIHLYDSNDALMLKMVDGDIDKLIQGKKVYKCWNI